ncbi:hypothetical protein Tco_0499938 [Tanacetum coccineum]
MEVPKQVCSTTWPKSHYVRLQATFDIGVGNQDSNGVHRNEQNLFEFEIPAVSQRRFGGQKLEEKTNTNFLVKEQEKVHLGIKMGANITVTGVPGQEGAEGNVAEKKKANESMEANLEKLLKYNVWSTR